MIHIIQHTARYIAARPHFIETLRFKEGRNPKFAFLFDQRNEHHPYFRWFEHATKHKLDPDRNPYDPTDMSVGMMATKGRIHVKLTRTSYSPMNPMTVKQAQNPPDRRKVESRIEEFYKKIKAL
jgi:hypothetical protein